MRKGLHPDRRRYPAHLQPPWPICASATLKRFQRMLQAQHRDIVGGEILRLIAQPGLVPFMAAVAVLALPNRLVQSLHRAEERLALDQLGDALAVDCRIAEIDRMVEKDRRVRRQLGDLLAQHIERQLVVTLA